VEKELSPRIGTFSQTGTLGDLIHRPLPARLSLVHGLERGIPSFGYLRGDVIAFPLFDNVPHGLARTLQRSRCFEVGNRLSRSLTALAVFAIAGKIGLTIDLVHLRVGSAHALTRLVGSLVQGAASADTRGRASSPAAERSLPAAVAQRIPYRSSQDGRKEKTWGRVMTPQPFPMVDGRDSANLRGAGVQAFSWPAVLVDLAWVAHLVAQLFWSETANGIAASLARTARRVAWRRDG